MGKLQVLLFSEDKESVVQGMSLIEQLDEEVYYDGICTFLEEDEHKLDTEKGTNCSE